MNKASFKRTYLIWGLIVQFLTIMAESRAAGSQASMELEQKLKFELTSETQALWVEMEREQTEKGRDF